MTVQITKSSNPIDAMDRANALQAIEKAATTSQLLKLKELAEKPGALPKFEKNFNKLKKLIKLA